MVAEISEYKGIPVLVLKRNDEDKFPFQFGMSKAKLILEHIDYIKEFVQSNQPIGRAS